MSGRKFKFHNGGKGAALAIRVKPGARQTRFKKVLRDGTVIVQYRAGAGNINQELIKFLADELGIAEKRFQIVAGKDGKNKLVSILDMQPDEIQQVILARITN